MNANPDIDLDKAVKLWDGLMARKKIAESLGVAEGVLKHFIEKNRSHFQSRKDNRIPPEGGWTPDEDAKLAELWATGLSALEIGHAIGKSRVQVLSRAHLRRNLCPQRKAGETYRSPLRQRIEDCHNDAAAFRQALVDPQQSNAYDAERLPLAKTLMDRQRDECCWPINAGGPFLYCAASVLSETEYCGNHHNRMRRPRELF